MVVNPLYLNHTSSCFKLKDVIRVKLGCGWEGSYINSDICVTGDEQQKQVAIFDLQKYLIRLLISDEMYALNNLHINYINMNSPSYTPVDLVGEKPYLPIYKNSFEETKRRIAAKLNCF